jgi:N-acetylneuraminic acid mutarotase
MVYDPVNERVLLFGGTVWKYRYIFFDDLWSYYPTTNTWTEIEYSSGPSGRFNHMMVYDPDRHQLFIFGGHSARGRIGDTWTYDIEANEWTQLHPQDSPSPRGDAAIAYDEANGVIVLHDGYCRDHSHPQDTWVYDFGENNWTLMDPGMSPKPQYGHHMIYDTRNGMLVMYGGHWVTSSTSHGYSDGVWTYDFPTDTWTMIDRATTPPGRYWHNLVYDGGSGNMVVFGGELAGDISGSDTWLFDASTNSWEAIISDETPLRRANSAMAYDPVHGKIIMFGGLAEWGEPSLDDLWILDTAEGTWREVSSEHVSTDGEDDEPSQTGIPGFPLHSIILSMALIMLLLVGGRRSSTGFISAQAG